MSIFTEFSGLFPYLQSVRKLEDFISFDILFPTSWKLPKKYINEEKVFEQESQSPNERLFSFLSKMDESELNISIDNIKSLIKYNIEREEKNILFEKKVEELKVLFEKTPLESLKNLKFEIKVSKLKLEDKDYEQSEISKLAGEGKK
jgi:hypothetical protein